MTMIASPELLLASEAAADELAALREAIAALPETDPAAEPAVRPLPTLRNAVDLLRTARRAGDRHGVRLFSRLIDRILDASHTPAPTGRQAPNPGFCAGLADVLDDIEQADEAQGYEDAEDALRQWAAQGRSRQADDPGVCRGCGNWASNCTCLGPRTGR